MSKKLFTFDVTLKELMNLKEYAKEFPKLGATFSLLKMFWYNLPDKIDAIKRWNGIRVGSIYVFLDDDNSLHLDFVTRFRFADKTPYLDAFDLVAQNESGNFPDYLKDFEGPNE